MSGKKKFEINESKSSSVTDETLDLTESSTTHDSISACNDHFNDGGACSKEEGKRLLSHMAEALKRAREDGLPDSMNKKPPLSAALSYLARMNIRKRILHVGSAARMPPECSAPGGGIAYPKLTKFIFDYRIRDPDTPEVFLDDTKKYGKRMELYCGKDFQIEVSVLINRAPSH